MNDLQIHWNNERMDSLLSGISNMRPIASTGFSNLDAIIGGWSQGVSLISAPPAAGKSTWVLQSVDHVARFSNRRVIFVSCEMPSVSLIIKSICRLSGERDTNALSFGEVLSLSRKLADANNPRVKLLLSAIETYTNEIAPQIATLDDIQSVDDLFRLYETFPEDEPAPLCVVDYLQILRLQNADALSDYQEVARIMSSLCDLAKMHRIPVLAIASQNRGKRNTADFSALCGSSTLEYGANCVLFIEADEDEQNQQDCRFVTLKIAKSKYSRIGSFDMQFYPSSSRFVEVMKP
ncbi:DnaB-like helicase C-terminal domain-containing protein [Adlercreutzia sp. ZJ154]|uniref:DnaB-like helicase C-terminal domain-containing protein n=1 Tax=Adlercreutzia sp. ZJ154 TaxID=2709790 RepID=UPI0013E9F851|nr:DnaB-like helicase C-terminal domain-containing protein [Adlercreutzia sp. ZJ154]